MKPLGDRVLLERLDGDGREEITKGGIILPAHDVTLRHGNTKRIPDTYRAIVRAVSDGATKATQGELHVGDEVLVHTYDQTQERTLAGSDTRFGMLVSVEDIVGIIDPPTLSNRERRAMLDAAQPSCLMPKTKNFEPPASVKDLGFFTRAELGEDDAEFLKGPGDNAEIPPSAARGKL